MEPSIYDLLMAEDEPTAAARAQALAGNVERERALGLLGQLTGDRVLSGFGGNLAAGAERRQAQLAEAPGARLRQLLDKQRYSGTQAELDEANAPANAAAAQLAKKFGMALPEGMTNRGAKEWLALAEKGYAADQRAKELQLNRSAQMPPLTIITGEGGQRFFVDPRHPERPGKPVVGPDGGPILAEDRDAGQLDAPGWTRPKGAPAIKREEASDFRTSIASADDIRQSSAQLRQLIADHGSELWGETAATMDSLGTGMLLQVKELAKLGVLSKSDEELINKLIPKPTGREGATTSTASMLATLDQFDRTIQQKLSTKAKSLGYAPPPANATGGADSAPQLDKPPEGMKWQQSKKTPGKYRLVPIGGG